MATDLDRMVTARLKADGQRYTANRQAVVAVLVKGDGPLTIPEVLDRAKELDGGRDLAQSSVYRNLAVLERAGVVQRIVTSDEFARYELAEDLTEHHHHLICTVCGGVSDVTVSADLEQTLDAALAKVARKAGFALDHHRLDLVGRCARCR